MITSVYLSNQNVLVTAGTGSSRSARVRKAWSLELDEGTMINGIITNDDDLKDQLDKFWRENRIPKKKVRLVLESSRLISKRFDIPKLKEKKIYEILPNEFSDIEDTQETVYDYMYIGTKKKTMDIRAVATPRSYVNEFVQLFLDIGVTITSITLGRSCLFHVLASIKNLKKKMWCFRFWMAAT